MVCGSKCRDSSFNTLSLVGPKKENTLICCWRNLISKKVGRAGSSSMKNALGTVKMTAKSLMRLENPRLGNQADK